MVLKGLVQWSLIKVKKKKKKITLTAGIEPGQLLSDCKVISCEGRR